MENIKRPSLLLYFTEGVRALIDYFRGLFFVWAYSFQKIGQGQPVLALPGLLCTDFTTQFLRRFINRLGFTAYGWEHGRNLGHFTDLDYLNQRVNEIYQKHNQKITLIGWSMGGIYARELAKQRPEMFNQVITMGSPFANIFAPNNVTWIYNILNDPNSIDPNFVKAIPNPAPVPTTAIYSKQDGVVPWEACQEIVSDKIHHNLEVKGSHCGLGLNPDVLQIVAEKLAAN